MMKQRNMLACVGKFLSVALLFVSQSISALELDVPDELKKDYECMVRNLHHEARGENSKGMIAVANVVMNRVKHKRFPSSICEVVYQKHQFSWVKKVKPTSIKNADDTAKLIAYEAIVNNTLKDITGGALFFHANYSGFSWDKTKIRLTKSIGRHIFYTYRGVTDDTRVRRI